MGKLFSLLILGQPPDKGQKNDFCSSPRGEELQRVKQCSVRRCRPKRISSRQNQKLLWDLGGRVSPQPAPDSALPLKSSSGIFTASAGLLLSSERKKTHTLNFRIGSLQSNSSKWNYCHHGCSLLRFYVVVQSKIAVIPWLCYCIKQTFRQKYSPVWKVWIISLSCPRLGVSTVTRGKMIRRRDAHGLTGIAVVSSLLALWYLANGFFTI